MIILILLYTLCEGLELFIVPHSHCDPGWLETFESYYQTKVRSILKNVVTLLEEDENRKFVWSETSYLKMWMDDQPANITDKFRNLVKKGQIEFVGGGYVQGDEANADFDMVIRQIETGHQYLYKEFGVDRVRTGWQIDIFGHSALTPGIFSRFGYEYLVINRVNEAFRSQLRGSGDMEFIWKGVNFGGNEALFTHILYDYYYPPGFLQTNSPEMCFGKENPTQNDIKACAERLYNTCLEWSAGYKTDKLMMIYGGDFFFNFFPEAKLIFERLEQVMDWMKFSGLYPDFDIKFATTTEYFDAVRKSNKKFPVYKSDFFPYQSYRFGNRPAFWTGFYTTRPALKQLINKTHRLVRAAEIAKALIEGETYISYNASLALHHDGITGTSKSWVAKDYKLRLKYDYDDAYQAIYETMSTAFTKKKQDFGLTLPYKVLVLYNSINWEKTDIIILESETQYLEIKNWKGENIESQSIANDDKNNYSIYIKLTFPAMSFVTIFVTEHSNPCKKCSQPSVSRENSTVVYDKRHSIEFDSNGFVKSIQTLHKKYEFIQDFWFYMADRAGAYIFEPGDKGYKINDLQFHSLNIWKGPVANIAEVTWKRTVEKRENQDTYYQKLILFGEKSYIWKYGLYASGNQEIMMRIKSNDISIGDWFYTSNSGDLRKRKCLDSREFSNRDTPKDYRILNPEEKGENMYPIPGGFAINMGTEAFKMFPQFSLGAGMVYQKSFEILMHRHLFLDDNFGLGEGVDDKSYINYHFLAELSPLSQTEFKKTSLNAKTEIYQMWIQDPSTLRIVSEMKDAFNFSKEWDYISKYEFGFNDPYIYLSSAVIKEGQLLFRLWNLKNSYQAITFENFSIGRRRLLDGYCKDFIPIPWRENGKAIDFNNKRKSGLLLDRDIWDIDTLKGDQILRPYELGTFPVSRVKSYFGFFVSEPGKQSFLENSATLTEANPLDEGWKGLDYFIITIIAFFVVVAAISIYLKFRAKNNKNKDDQ